MDCPSHYWLRISRYLVIGALALLPLNYWRFAIGFIPTNFLELVILAAAVAYFIYFLKEKTRPLLPCLLPVVFILIGILAPSILAVDNRIALGIFKGWFFVPIVLFYLAVNLVYHDRKIVRWLNYALLFNALAVSAYAILQYFAVIPLMPHQAGDANILLYPKENRALAFFESPNFLAMYLTPLVIYLAITWLEEKRFLNLFWLVLPTAAIYLSRSSGALLALMICALFYLSYVFFYQKNQRRQFYLTLTLTLIGLALIIGLNLEDGRRAIYRVSLDLIKHYWLTGIGPGQFIYYFPLYKGFIDDGLYQKVLPYALHPHNIFLNYWLSGGLMALIGFIALLAKLFSYFKKAKGIMAASLVAIVSVVIHGLVDSTYFKTDLAIIFWLMAAFVLVNFKENANS